MPAASLQPIANLSAVIHTRMSEELNGHPNSNQYVSKYEFELPCAIRVLCCVILKAITTILNSLHRTVECVCALLVVSCGGGGLWLNEVNMKSLYNCY